MWHTFFLKKLLLTVVKLSFTGSPGDPGFPALPKIPRAPCEKENIQTSQSNTLTRQHLFSSYKGFVTKVHHNYTFLKVYTFTSLYCLTCMTRYPSRKEYKKGNNAPFNSLNRIVRRNISNQTFSSFCNSLETILFKISRLFLFSIQTFVPCMPGLPGTPGGPSGP